MGDYALAIDIGASGGRHILGRIVHGCVELTEVYHFPNEIVTCNGLQCWDMEALFAHVVAGMRACADRGMTPATVSIDTWGVDYTLIDTAGKPLGPSVAYRDARTGAMPALLDAAIPPEALYARTGIARQPYNTVYQLMAEAKAAPAWPYANARLLFTPCYLQYRLTGIARNEFSIASTSGLLNARTGLWDEGVLAAAGIPPALLGDAPARSATLLGPLLPAVERLVGYPCTVVLPASHDTASAFLAAPLSGEGAAVLSSGTWSLLGQELDAPILTEAARLAGFTNESGYGGHTTFVRNIIGLWLLQAIRREWGKRLSYAEMAVLALEGKDYPHTFDASSGRFLSPAGMTAEIASALLEMGAPPPQSDAQLLYCVHQSLALCYGSAIKQLSALTQQPITKINVVGGGSQNTTLNQFTANATGLPVYAGPVEATALGNVTAQWIATNELQSLTEVHALIQNSIKLEVYQPQSH
ncbi:MAG: rhamnulokinase family protein [Candidatus Limiplasma sp.]|nr:rhamnulokinase family protein [Candidatus Limiplasma sp.]